MHHRQQRIDRVYLPGVVRRPRRRSCPASMSRSPSAPGTVAIEAVGDMEVLLEMVLEREVEEGRAGRRQLHAGGESALHQRQIASRQMPVQIRHEGPHLDARRRVRATAGRCAGRPPRPCAAQATLLGPSASSAGCAGSDARRRPIPRPSRCRPAHRRGSRAAHATRRGSPKVSGCSPMM